MQLQSLVSLSLFYCTAPHDLGPHHQPEDKVSSEEYYDDIYFDSSGSEDEGGGADEIRKVGKKIRKMTNDELFYDPKMDEEDEKWIKRQRMTYLNGRLITCTE